MQKHPQIVAYSYLPAQTGNMSEVDTDNDAFMELVKALRPSSRVYSLSAVRELSITKIELTDKRRAHAIPF